MSEIPSNTFRQNKAFINLVNNLNKTTINIDEEMLLNEAYGLSLKIETKIRSIGTLLDGFSENQASNINPSNLKGLSEILLELADHMRPISQVLDLAETKKIKESQSVN